MKEKKRERKLTPEDLKLIEMIAQGYSDNEIAAELGKTYSAIRNRYYRIQLNTGTVNKPHLVSWAYKNRILKVK